MCLFCLIIRVDLCWFCPIIRADLCWVCSIIRADLCWVCSIIRADLCWVCLFGALAQTDPSLILIKNDSFREFKGILSELYVAQQLTAQNKKLYYYSGEDSRVEIDFILQNGIEVLPIEVKAEGNVKGKSLKLFISKNSIPNSIRFSMLPYIKQENITNIPLYCAFCFKNYLTIIL